MSSVEGIPFEKLNPILQAEYIAWTDMQYDRLKDVLYKNVSRKDWLEKCIEIDATENLYRSIIVSAYTVGPSNALRVAEASGIDSDIVDDAMSHVCSVYRLDEIQKSLGRMVKDGRHPLEYMVLPHSGNLVANFPPLALDDCAHFRKAGNRVYQFLMALGEPDDALRKEYLEDILCVQTVTERAFKAKEYEQHLMLDVSEGEQNRTVFIDFYAGPVNCIVLVREKGMDQRAGAYIISTRRELTGEKYDQDNSFVSNLDGEKYKWAFDLLVNAWVAEKTGMAVVSDEPKPEKARVRNIVKNATGRDVVEGVVYDYIRVTDKAWGLHKESQKALSEHSADSTWVKAMWWRRQHFAIRGEHKVFIKGHWCHRKCGPVTEEPEVVEILI